MNRADFEKMADQMEEFTEICEAAAKKHMESIGRKHTRFTTEILDWGVRIEYNGSHCGCCNEPENEYVSFNTIMEGME